MTDKELKTLLTPVPKQDEEFVQQVMRQLPQSDLSWRPVWTIRLVALILGVIVLACSQELTHFFSDIVHLAHSSWTIMLFGGIFVAGTTLYICHEREII